MVLNWTSWSQPLQACVLSCQICLSAQGSFETQCLHLLWRRVAFKDGPWKAPFTTKQVEDIKAFWGILKVVFSIGPIFMIQVAAQSMLPLFAQHSNIYEVGNVSVHVEGIARHIFISNGLLSPLLVVVCIPLYLCLIRPRISFHVPGILKRIGLGIILLIISLILTLAMDMVVHTFKTDENCMISGFSFVDRKGYRFHQNYNSTTLPLYQDAYFFISQHIF